MKKKYRKAIYLAIFLPVYLLVLPFALIAIIGEWLLDRADGFGRWLTNKLKVSKYDPELFKDKEQ